MTQRTIAFGTIWTKLESAIIVVGREIFMPQEPMRAATDVLVIGSGAAGMYAAIEAARGGCQVLLADRSLIDRGGATVMAQMTVAVAFCASTPR